MHYGLKVFIFWMVCDRVNKVGFLVRCGRHFLFRNQAAHHLPQCLRPADYITMTRSQP